MSGARYSVTRATPRTPPKTTAAVRAATTTATAHAGTPCPARTVSEIALAWTMGIATTMATTRTVAKTTPHRCEPRPRSR